MLVDSHGLVCITVVPESDSSVGTPVKLIVGAHVPNANVREVRGVSVFDWD